MPNSSGKSRSSTTPIEPHRADYGLKRVEGVAADLALFQNMIDGLVVAVPSNEFPLQGLAGLLDWRFHGVLSQFQLDPGSTEVTRGFSGKLGELTLLPLQHRGKRYQALLVGTGPVARPGARSADPLDPLTQTLGPALEKLGWKTPGFSRKDWGDADITRLNQLLGGKSGLVLD